MTEPHPFAQYVRILGRGKSFQRGFTEEEAEASMGMILDDQVEPEQLGAFLMLLRVKEETPEEVAGFVRAAKSRFTLPDPMPSIDLDWSSYAGKRRQLPWFLLSALVLAANGVRIFMHGTEGHTPGRVYTRETLEALGLPVAQSLTEAASQIDQSNFAYLPLAVLSPRFHAIIELRPLLGLRSPVHTVARMLNPFDAPYLLQGVFHPGYNLIHQGAAALLGQPHMAVFRGEGGEIERRASKPCEVFNLHDGVLTTVVWPPLLDDSVQPHDEEMSLERLAGVWAGTVQDDYADAAITGTLAIALHQLGRAADPASAQVLAKEMWQARDRDRLAA